MRRDLYLSLIMLLAGCGYVGNPLPPAVNIPQPIRDLKATQVGDHMIVEFTEPILTTEGLKVKRIGSLDVRVGKAQPEPINVVSWAAEAKTYPAQLDEAPVMKLSIPVKDWVGQDVAIGVRTTSPKGKPSGWSNIWTLHVAAPPAVPADLKAESDPKGARLTWTGSSPSYRVFRRLPDEKDFLQIGEPTEAAFVDETAEYDKKYVYSVVAVDGGAKSTESKPIEFTPIDKFPPDVPKGLAAIIGPSSIELAWESNTEPDLRAYRVYRSIGASGEYQMIADLVEVPAYSDKKLQAGQKHSYKVSAVDKHGNESEKSGAVSVDAP